MKIAIGALAVVLVLAACGGHSGHGTVTNSNTAGAANADDAAASFGRALGSWADAVSSAVSGETDYADQIGVKHDTSQQLATQKSDCDKMSAAIPVTRLVPKLQSMPADGSLLYEHAAATAATLPARSAAVRTDLQKLVRFCTWLDTFNVDESTAISADSQLFSKPLRYTGTTTVNGVAHTCPSGASCATPDQSQWAQIAKLWRQAGAATAEGPQRIVHDKTPCLLEGWDTVCNLIVQDQLDYQTWTDKFAATYEMYATQPLQTALIAVGYVGGLLQTDVVAPLQPLAADYAKLDQVHKYSSRTSTLGIDIWVAQAKQLQATLTTDLAALNH